MLKHLKSFSVLLLIAALLQPGFVSSAPAGEAVSGLSKAQLAQLQRGEVLMELQRVQGNPKGVVTANIQIDAPAEIIWRIMTDCPRAPTYVPGLKSCRVLASGENWEIIQHTVKWNWFLPEVVYVFRADYRRNRQIDFVRVRGDLNELSGSWHLDPLDHNRTIVGYSVYLDPGFFIPQWMVRRALKRDLPAMLASLRQEVMLASADAAEGTYKK